MRSAGAEIGEAEADVGGNHADQRHVRKVVALGDHLRADQDVDVAAGDALQHLDQAALPPHGVAIEARDPRAGERGANVGLDALGAEADAFHVRRGALLARFRHDLLKLQ